MQDLHWHNIWSTDNPVEVLNEHLQLLVRRFVPTTIIRVCNKDKPWFDDPQAGSSSSVDPVITLGLTGMSLSTVK